jgi:uncharacterized protein (TIGR00369 family)
MTGLELLQAVLSGERMQPPIGAALNMTLVEAEPGRVVFEGRPTHDHLNVLGVVHGGYAGVLLDSAMGCALLSLLPTAGGIAAASFEVKLVRPVMPASLVAAEGLVVYLGRSHGVAEASLRDVSTGKLLACGTTTCFVLETIPGPEGWEDDQTTVTSSPSTPSRVPPIPAPSESR